ncbi:MAG TPA: hypothetical protein VNL74_00020 [Methylococcus sp.]|nr:hypothetical protein [Methylococcus sp.]
MKNSDEFLSADFWVKEKQKVNATGTVGHARLETGEDRIDAFSKWPSAIVNA